MCEVDEYYYVYMPTDSTTTLQNNFVMGYIKKDSSIIPCPANNSPEIGAIIQPLHPNIVVYKYPFDSNQGAVDYDLSVYTQLIVENNVGEDGEYFWGWYKVSYMDDNTIKTGYVRHKDVSPYTPLSAPAISKTVKVTSQKLGEYIKIYALPSDDALVLGELKEGSSIDLAEKYNENSEWTMVYYNGATAYIKTANIHIDGLTSWQLALAITIPIVVVAIIVTIIILLVVRRKKFLNRF